MCFTSTNAAHAGPLFEHRRVQDGLLSIVCQKFYIFCGLDFSDVSRLDTDSIETAGQIGGSGINDADICRVAKNVVCEICP